MAESVLEHHEMQIQNEDDIVLVRRKARDIAQACGFDIFAVSAVTTAASELARNVWVHAGQGIAFVERLADGARSGVRVVFKDEGPGIPDVERVLSGGYSTAKSMGLGLSGSRRLVDEFSIESTVGQGTTVTFVKWTPY
ncbi:anti-sigma regulatory factor [Pendulispora brunnea]|uniref:Anti-sigma regulatory factor n=1 Tax=Pendulispora brunnea TaxID=2905690 RepID=A0ABZ2K5X0_9BACT